jgi:hypothetical protein
MGAATTTGGEPTVGAAPAAYCTRTLLTSLARTLRLLSSRWQVGIWYQAHGAPKLTAWKYRPSPLVPAINGRLPAPDSHAHSVMVQTPADRSFATNGI